MRERGGNITFALDASLGRLTKYLRLMGFDAEYQAGGDAAAFFRGVGDDRIALTRIRQLCGRLPQKDWYLVQDDDPDAQVGFVLAACRIEMGDLRPFSRCIQCNRPVQALEKETLRGRVPEYVWQTQTRFSGCPRCGKVFWSGSHTQRAQEKINQRFKRSSIRYHGK